MAVASGDLKLIATGRYRDHEGGMAHVWANRRADTYRAHFGCPLIGSFNVRLGKRLTWDATPARQFEIEDNEQHHYYLCRLTNEGGESTLGWTLRWTKPGDRWHPHPNRLEVYTKRPIPDSFREGALAVELLHPMPREEITAWAAPLYWWQGFPWLPKPRADSAMLWDFLGRDNYEGKIVLDFGCHTGFHSFEASKRGATVVGIDADAGIIDRARFINDHIEMQDCTFAVGDEVPRGTFDIAFCLSVQHQPDPAYAKLPELIERLKAAAPIVWLELINPPLKGKLSERDVDCVVGADPVLHYRHNVRRMRSLYRLDGVK